jgi:response regulator NasT
MTPKKNINLLIAEDDLDISRLLRKELEKLGYSVIGQAANGEQAVQMAQSLPLDLILMDVGMPKMDGLEATRLIQDQCPTPIIIWSASPFTELVKQAQAAGATTCLSKPADIEEIEQAIIEALARFREK